MFLTKKAKDEQAFSNGLLAVIDKNYPLAIELLTRAAELDHHNATAFLVLGNIYRLVGQVSRAVNIHEPLTLRKHLASQDKLKIYLALAEDYQALGHVEKAIENQRKAIALDNKNTVLKKALFYYLKKQKRWEDAFAVWESVRKLDKSEPVSVLAYLEVEMAETAFRNNENRTAEKKVRQALNLYSECIPARLLKGDLYQAAQKDEAAFKEWA